MKCARRHDFSGKSISQIFPRRLMCLSLHRNVRCLNTCGAAARRITGNHSWEAQASEVQSKLVVVVFANQLGVHLGNAVNGARPLDLRKWVLSIEQTSGFESGGPTVTFGVGLRGLSGPKAPIVLGTKMRSLYCFASSMTLWTPSMLTLRWRIHITYD